MASSLLSLLLTGITATDGSRIQLLEATLSVFPEADLRAFREAGWLQPAAEASMIVCPGCEEQCAMLVRIIPKTQRHPLRRVIDCDRRDDMGRISVEPWQVVQYQFTLDGLLGWLQRAMAFDTKPEPLIPGRLWDCGTVAASGFHSFLCRGIPAAILHDHSLVKAKAAVLKVNL